MTSNWGETEGWNLYFIYKHIANLMIMMDEATYGNDAKSKLKLMNMIVNHVHYRLLERFPKQMPRFDKQLVEIEGLLQMDDETVRGKAGQINQERIQSMALSKLNRLDRELNDMMTECNILPKNADKFEAGEIVKDMF